MKKSAWMSSARWLLEGVALHEKIRVRKVEKLSQVSCIETTKEVSYMILDFFSDIGAYIFLLGAIGSLRSCMLACPSVCSSLSVFLFILLNGTYLNEV